MASPEGEGQRGTAARERLRVKKKRVSGRVVEWKERERFGWIKPDAAINHDEAGLHGGKVYVHSKDVHFEEDQSTLKVGDPVTFIAYADGKGLGAMDCRIRCDVTKPKAKKQKLAEPELDTSIIGGLQPAALNSFASDGSFLAFCRSMQLVSDEVQNSAGIVDAVAPGFAPTLVGDAAEEAAYDPWANDEIGSLSSHVASGFPHNGITGKNGKGWQNAKGWNNGKGWQNVFPCDSSFNGDYAQFGAWHTLSKGGKCGKPWFDGAYSTDLGASIWTGGKSGKHWSDSAFGEDSIDSSAWNVGTKGGKNNNLWW